MLFAVNLFAVSEHRDLLAFRMFTSLFGVCYHVISFMPCTSSWWISRKPVVDRRITSGFLTPFVFHVDMIWVFVNRAIKHVIRPGYSVRWLCTTPRFSTPFVFHVDMIWVFVNKTKYRVLRPGYSIHWVCVTSGVLTSFILHVDMIRAFVNRAKYRALRSGYSV